LGDGPVSGPGPAIGIAGSAGGSVAGDGGGESIGAGSEIIPGGGNVGSGRLMGISLGGSPHAQPASPHRTTAPNPNARVMVISPPNSTECSYGPVRTGRHTPRCLPGLPRRSM